MDPPLRRPLRGRSVAFAAGGGFWFSALLYLVMGSFGQALLGLLIVALVLPVALLVWLGTVAVMAFAALRRSQAVTTFPRTLGLASCFALAQIPGSIAGIFVEEFEIGVAKRWCEGLGPRLEELRTHTGAYPAELSALGGDLDPPRYCRKELFYRATPTGYMLDFADSGPLSGWIYRSEGHTWSHYH